MSLERPKRFSLCPRIRGQKIILPEGLADMRKTFDEQLLLLNNELIKMGALCETAISTAIKSITEDKTLAKNTFEADSEIDKLERDIEDICLKLLLRQQPVARDLRTISSALKMISDMERIGDQASDIAEMADYVYGHTEPGGVDIRIMASQTIKMVTDSIDSFVNRDLSLAHSVVIYDDIVDKSFSDIKAELIRLIAEGHTDGEYYVDLLMTAKYLERIGDHATNIAEWVEFSITGEHID